MQDSTLHSEPLRLPEKSAFSDRAPDADELVHWVLRRRAMTEHELRLLLAHCPRESIDRSLMCGLYGGSIRYSGNKLYGRRQA